MAADQLLVDGIGWAATGVFVGSYFFARAGAIRRTQMAGALLWLVYGLLINAYPVIVANVLVFGAAAWSLASVDGSRSDVSQRLRHRAPGTSHLCERAERRSSSAVSPR